MSEYSYVIICAVIIKIKGGFEYFYLLMIYVNTGIRCKLYFV